jgi:hypothetical protein
VRQPPIFIITVFEIPSTAKIPGGCAAKVMEDQASVLHAVARTLRAIVARERKGVTVRTVELTHASFAASVRSAKKPSQGADAASEMG